MKKCLLLVAALLTVATLTAAQVDQNQVKQVARAFAAGRLGNVDLLNAEVVYTHPMPESRAAAFHMVNIGDNGFVMVAADKVAHPILGYSFDRQWPAGELPPQITGFFDDIAAQIEAASGQEPDCETASEWAQWLSDNPPVFDTRDEVGPLLTTTWDQGMYYNNLCPADANGPNGHALAGCVATAMAQIIKYWGYPQQGRGTHSYQSDYYGGGPYGTISANFNASTYNYSSMPNALNSTSSSSQINAVAKLMSDCGIAATTKYNVDESMASVFDVRAVLTDYFKYSPESKYSDKQYWTDSDWILLINSNLSKGQPILYTSEVFELGDPHSNLFVCDGYNHSNYYHFNFGWGGQGDGWYQLSAINPGAGLNYTSNQGALLDITPEITESNILYAQQSWTQHSSFTVSEPVELMGVMANIPYLFFGGFMFENHVLTFYPTDPNKQLVLYVMDRVNLITNFYDGPSTEDELIRTFVGYGGVFYNLDLSPIVTTNHALTIELESAAWDFGNHFLIAEYDGCAMATNIQIEPSISSVSLSWDENDCATQWEVEYGNSGFVQGNGTIVTTNTNSITITGLSNLELYDFYIRPICGDGYHGMWSNPVTTMILAPLWTDMVTEQPLGYEVDDSGNVTISTAEGLAWLSKVANDTTDYNPFYGKTIRLTADIDMGGYVWYPLYLFMGTFDGDGHAINNFYVLSQSGGLITFLQGGTVKNVSIIDCYIDNLDNDAAGIAGTASNAQVFNCFVKGTLKSDGRYSAGIVTNSFDSDIINCASNGYFSSLYWTSGICSCNSGGRIKNCYSAAWINPQINGAGVSCNNYNDFDISNCYSHRYRTGPYEIACPGEGITNSLTYFYMDGNECMLWDPIVFDDMICNQLLEALNRGVTEQNIPGLKLWKSDTFNINEGFPILDSNEAPVTCINVSDVTLRMIEANQQYGLEVSWQENGDADTWEILCLKDNPSQTVDTVGITTAYSIPDTLWNLTEGITYYIQVRPICDNNTHGSWSNNTQIIFDKPYWNDIITSQPSGYYVDPYGNVTISSAEGLSWFSSMANGDNGQTTHTFNGKIITLTCNVDIGQYRWKPINRFYGVFNADGHAIDNLFIRETTDYIGFFSRISEAIIENVAFNNATIEGHNIVGTICGISDMSTLANCFVNNTTVQGNYYAGGLVGEALYSSIDYCSISGDVMALDMIAGGIVALTNGADDYYDQYIRNCFSTGTVSSGDVAGGIVGEATFIPIQNCYSLSNIGCFVHGGGIVGESYNGVFDNCYTSFYHPEEPGYLVNGQFPVGVLVGVNSRSLTMRNIYYPQNQGIPVVGAHDPLEQSCILIDTSSFAFTYPIAPLDNPITINNVQYQDLLSVLNAWVDANDRDGIYQHWVASTPNVNYGLPMLEEKPNSTLGIKEITDIQSAENTKAFVFPNPTNGVFTIEADAMTHLTVTNAFGQVVYNADVKGDVHQLNLGHCKAGLYLVQVITEKGTDTKRIILMK